MHQVHICQFLDETKLFIVLDIVYELYIVHCHFKIVNYFTTCIHTVYLLVRRMEEHGGKHCSLFYHNLTGILRFNLVLEGR